MNNQIKSIFIDIEMSFTRLNDFNILEFHSFSKLEDKLSFIEKYINEVSYLIINTKELKNKLDKSIEDRK